MIKANGEKVELKAVRDEFKHDIGAELAVCIVSYIQEVLEQSGIEDVTEREAEAARCMTSMFMTAIDAFYNMGDVEGCTALYASLKQSVKALDDEMREANAAEIPAAFGAKVAGRSDN